MKKANKQQIEEAVRKLRDANQSKTVEEAFWLKKAAETILAVEYGFGKRRPAEFADEVVKQINDPGPTVDYSRVTQDEMVEHFDGYFNERFPGYNLSNQFKNGNNSLRKFLNELPHVTVIDAFKYSCQKLTDPNAALKYFCGICHNKIRNKEPNQQADPAVRTEGVSR